MYVCMYECAGAVRRLPAALHGHRQLPQGRPSLCAIHTYTILHTYTETVVRSGHPKAVYRQLLRFPGLQLLPAATGPGSPSMSAVSAAVSWEELDRPLYLAVAQALLQYTRSVLSSRSMARFHPHTIPIAMSVYACMYACMYVCMYVCMRYIYHIFIYVVCVVKHFPICQ